MELLKYANGNLPQSEQERQAMIEQAAGHYAEFMKALKFDFKNDPNSADTPRRVAKAWVNDLIAGKALNVGANVLLNPLYTIKAAERFASAPVRAASSLLGINADQSKVNARENFGNQNIFVYKDGIYAQDIGSLVQAAADTYNTGHTIRLPAGNGAIYYTVENKNNPDSSKNYVVTEAEINRQPIGRMPVFTNKLRSNIDALKKPPLSGSRAPTIDSAFFDALKGVADELKKGVASISKDTKNEISTKLLYIPSLTEFEIKGYLTNKLPNDNFVISENYT